MAKSLQEIENDVRALRASERKQLLRELIANVDGGESEDNVEELWLKEVRQRYKEIQNGTVRPVSAEEVVRNAKNAHH